MNNLNVVSVEKTLRIKAESAASAANIAADYSFGGRDSINVAVSHDDDSVFIARSTIGESVFYDVIYIDCISSGNYRVEVGKAEMNDLEYVYFTGGDNAVNNKCFYRDKEGSFISQEDYMTELEYWINLDEKEGTPGRMESYIKKRYCRVEMLDGVIIVPTYKSACAE